MGTATVIIGNIQVKGKRETMNKISRFVESAGLDERAFHLTPVVPLSKYNSTVLGPRKSDYISAGVLPHELVMAGDGAIEVEISKCRLGPKTKVWCHRFGKCFSYDLQTYDLNGQRYIHTFDKAFEDTED